MTHAGSRYAYSTLGSTLAVHAETYAQVRGFPRRNAGEDFYLLNKVAKVASISQLCSAKITLQARRSDRVPFGTGPALSHICELLKKDPSGQEYLSYAPATFDLLALALIELNRFATNEHPVSDPTVLGILQQLGWDRVKDQLQRQYSQPRQRQRAVMDWFDALKTLRFVHQSPIVRQPLLQSLNKSIHDFSL